MTPGALEAALLDGYEDLEVVGESFHQDNLWRLVGGRSHSEAHARKDIYAMLLPEEGNPYDAQAISVWIDGLMVGHIPREDAAHLRPGLVALLEREAKPIALSGVITGGGMREDGPGRLGVFLEYDPEDFELPGPTFKPRPNRVMRTGLSGALATDDEDDSYDLGWIADLPSDRTRAISMLRGLLKAQADAISRHFMFAHLESLLYHCRDAFSSALDEYDTVCKQHDAEMDAIRTAFMAKWGKVPLIELYPQMAIRQQKLHDYGQAIWWAQRGIEIYGDDAARPDAVEDLHDRAAKYRAKRR